MDAVEGTPGAGEEDSLAGTVAGIADSQDIMAFIHLIALPP